MVNHTLGMRKRIKIEFYILFICFICLIIRIGYIQLIKGKVLRQMAYDQQSIH